MAMANSADGGNSTSTLYYQGGQVMTNSEQTTDLWTNALVSIDLDRDWGTGTPAITLVQADNANYSSPPAVSRTSLRLLAARCKASPASAPFATPH